MQARSLRLAVALGAVLLGTASDGSAAEPPSFALPVDCEFGATCSIQNYFDHDPGLGVRDYACGVLSYDGHWGTDIRVPDVVAMRRGVAVVAAAPGRVRGVRDGMPDVDVRDIGRAALNGRDAGNTVVIDHGGGWHTQYGHLRRGSVAVSKGEAVTTGQRLGLIGMSGRAAFPHVHFEVRIRDRQVDPFTGLGAGERCGPGEAPLWNAAALEVMAYTPTGLLSAGFASRKPDARAARRGDYRASRLPRNAPALVFWISVYGVRSGDVEVVRLVAPDGAVVAKKAKLIDTRKAQWFSFVGRKWRGVVWPAGVYRGEFILLRQVDGTKREVLNVVREIVVR